MSSKVKIFQGRGASSGSATGHALVFTETLQGDSAINLDTGEIIQENHPLLGQNISGSVMVLDGGRGSTGWSCRLNAAYVKGVGPVAMIFPKMDARTAGATATLNIPVVTDFTEDLLSIIKSGDRVTVDSDAGEIRVESSDTSEE